MRKFVIGSIVGLTFVAYSFVLRHQHSEPVIALTPTSHSPAATATTPAPDDSNSNTATSPVTTAAPPRYRDGGYTGRIENAFYGNVQVSATIQSGNITAINFLQAPNENPNSVYVNQQADPVLKQEAIQAQSANVSIVSGATLTSQAFIQSLTTALNQAKP